MMRIIVFCFSVVLCLSAEAGVSFQAEKGVVNPSEALNDAPAMISTSIVFSNGAALLVKYQVNGSQMKLQFDVGALDRLGLTAGDFEDKIIEAINAGDSRYYAISIKSAIKSKDDVYLVYNFEAETLAAPKQD